jgi:hypothetical protein
MKSILLILVLIGLALAQSPEGTAERCSNMKGEAHPCDCFRTQLCKAEPDAKCKTYCYPSKCFCKTTPCSSMHMK